MTTQPKPNQKDRDPLQNKIDALEAENNLLRMELNALKEWKQRIEPVLRQSIETALELKKKNG